MHARISTWRVRPEDYEPLSQEVAPHTAELKRQPGYVAGYEVRPTPDRFLTITIWESEAQMEAAFAKVMPALSRIMEGRVELVDRVVGPAQDFE